MTRGVISTGSIGGLGVRVGRLIRMRLWLKDSERRPDPEPVKTDDRKVILAGLVLWLIALGGLLFGLGQLLAADGVWWLWTVLIGLGLGLVLLVFAHRKQS